MYFSAPTTKLKPKVIRKEKKKKSEEKCLQWRRTSVTIKTKIHMVSGIYNTFKAKLT